MHLKYIKHSFSCTFLENSIIKMIDITNWRKLLFWTKSVDEMPYTVCLYSFHILEMNGYQTGHPPCKKLFMNKYMKKARLTMRSACFSIAKVMRIQVALASEWRFCIGADCMRVTVMGVEWAFINIWKTIRIYHYARYLFFVNEYHRSALSEAQKTVIGPLRRDGFQFFCS